MERGSGNKSATQRRKNERYTDSMHTFNCDHTVFCLGYIAEDGSRYVIAERQGPSNRDVYNFMDVPSRWYTSGFVFTGKLEIQVKNIAWESEIGYWVKCTLTLNMKEYKDVIRNHEGYVIKRTTYDFLEYFTNGAVKTSMICNHKEGTITGNNYACAWEGFHKDFFWGKFGSRDSVCWYLLQMIRENQ